MRLRSRLSGVGKLVAAASIAIGTLTASLATAAPAFASPSGDLAAATNNARAAAGLPALRLDGQLDAVAQAWANQLAAKNSLSHNPGLRGEVTNWSYLGENVGMAGDIPSVQQAFMNSPEHRANILSSHYTLMGVGAATSTLPSCGCTVLWVVVDFKRPQTTAAPAPAPAPRPVTQPVTEPAAPPAPKPAAPPAPKQAEQAPAAAPTTHNARPATPAAPAANPAAVTRAETPTTTSPPATGGPSQSTSPSASASAKALNRQLAAVPSGTDPVSRVLTFASVMSSLPG